MAFVLKVSRVGNSLCLILPISLCRSERIKHGDYFKIEKDLLLPTFYLDKIGSSDGKVER